MADSTATPETAKPTFREYLKNNIPHHLRVLAIVALVMVVWVAVNYIRDLRQQMKNQAAITATLEQKFAQYGTAAVALNQEQSVRQLGATAGTSFDPILLAQMKQQKATIDALTTVVAQTRTTTAPVTEAQLAPLPADAAQGKLTGYPLEEVRPAGLPPLARVDLYYDPRAPDAATRFHGTTWTQYQETFHAAIGEWEQQKTGGMKTTVQLTRVVSRPDPDHPGALLPVGTEPIPLTGASTIYTPKSILGDNPTVLPRWTLSLGISHDSLNQYQAAGTLDYRLAGRYGIFAGTVNRAIVGGVSIRLGGPK